MADFAIEKTDRIITTTRGNRFQRQFYPAEGNTAAVLYVEVSPANKAAAAALVGQISGLAEETELKQWTAAAEDGKRPGVNARMLVSDDEPLAEE